MTTKHTCGGPVFGRLTEGCARCAELRAGAQPVRWLNTSRQDDGQRCREIDDHFRRFHRGGVCWRDGRPSRTCTKGDW